MKKRNERKGRPLSGQSSFNWQVLDDPRQDAGESDAPRSRQISQRAWLILVSSTLLILLTGYWAGQGLVNHAESNLHEVEGEVEQAIKHENDASLTGISAANEFSASSVISDVTVDVTLLQLHDTLAYVDVLVDDPRQLWINEPYHVGRILNESTEGWQPVVPENSFWGERHTLETTYFHLDYSLPDEQVVKQVAPDLDQLYLQLHTDLGLPAPSRDKRLEIHVAVGDDGEGSDTDIHYTGSTIYVYPPELIPRPCELSDVETLRQSITFPLATKLFFEASSRFNPPCEWRSVSEGIGLWLRWEGHTMPSRARWEYQQAIQEWNNPLSLPHLDQLLAIPRDCWAPAPSVDLDALSSARPVPRGEIAATLIEYMVATYGRQIIPQLFHDFQQYKDWKTLTQESLHISADELEASWHTYLITRAP